MLRAARTAALRSSRALLQPTRSLALMADRERSRTPRGASGPRAARMLTRTAGFLGDSLSIEAAVTAFGNALYALEYRTP